MLIATSTLCCCVPDQATNTLPPELHGYIPMIRSCPVPRWDPTRDRDNYDRVVYLTVGVRYEPTESARCEPRWNKYGNRKV